MIPTLLIISSIYLCSILSKEQREVATALSFCILGIAILAELMLAIVKIHTGG